eukprot:scaffold776_cov347-Pavlova_lutheri.AAC.78
MERDDRLDDCSHFPPCRTLPLGALVFHVTHVPSSTFPLRPVRSARLLTRSGSSSFFACGCLLYPCIRVRGGTSFSWPLGWRPSPVVLAERLFWFERWDGTHRKGFGDRGGVDPIPFIPRADRPGPTHSNGPIGFLHPSSRLDGDGEDPPGSQKEDPVRSKGNSRSDRKGGCVSDRRKGGKDVGPCRTTNTCASPSATATL